MKKPPKRLLLLPLALAAVVLALLWPRSAPDLPETPAAVTAPAASDQADSSAAEAAPEPDAPVEGSAALPTEAETAGAPAEGTSSPAQPEQGDAPAEAPPQTSESGQPAAACTLSISCAALLDNLDRLAPEKRELVPADGWVLAPVSVALEEGDSAFDLLRRTCRTAGIHMEFTDAPLYGGAYIEGICNLYEFDCGDSSGWMYRVNGVFPNYGCSQYRLQAGDTVEWVYTCDLGADVGG
jgi:hypothetical protein